MTAGKGRGARGPAVRLRAVVAAPFRRFFAQQAAGGIVLLGATIAALLWANSRYGSLYEAVWSARFGIGTAAFGIHKPLLLWVNDGLMAIFFLLVGLEIKRELLEGELSSRSRAALPIVAAVGGMIVPAALYGLVTRGTPVANAWGIPMATDIAFALGALAVLGRRVPLALRIFLAAAAIVDDIGAVLVIAVVYTPSVGWMALGAAAAVTVALALLNRAGVTNLAPYALLGVLLWVAVLKSGVHATIAGVILAFTVPSDRGVAGDSSLVRLEHALSGVVSFGIVPLFALANAGVRIEGDLAAALSAPVSLGILVGLLVGKQVGLLLFPWVAMRLGLTALPEGVTWRHMWGVSLLAGIGFTMSLFIAGLALPPEELARGKLAILVASTLAATGGILVLARRSSSPRAAEA